MATVMLKAALRSITLLAVLLLAGAAHAQTSVEVLDHNATGLQIANTTTETEIYGYDVAAFTIGDVYRGVIHTRIFGYALNGTGASKNATLRVKFGGNTHYAETIVTFRPTTVARPFMIDLYIIKIGATDRFAVLTGTLHQGNTDTNPTTGFGRVQGGNEARPAVFQGTELLEWLNVQNRLSVTMQWSAASPTLTLNVEHGYTLLE